MKVKIFRNWGLKLASIVLATVLWFLVVQIDDPQESRTFGNIKVNLINTELLDAESKVYEVLDNTDTVRVTIRAPRSVVEKIESTDIIAEADMSKLTDINTIAITYDIQNVDLDSAKISGNHDVVKLNVEEKSSKYISIGYKLIGEAASGYMIGNISMDQNMIEVSGPLSAVEQVASAGVDVNVSGTSNSLSANMEIKLYDSDGNIITKDNIEKQTDYARVSVEVLAVKEVPVAVGYTGEPASGYIVTGTVDMEPSTVKIAGSSATLSGIYRISIPDEEIDISGATEDVTAEIDISPYLANNVRLADSSFNGNVRATIHIEQLVSRNLYIEDKNISFTNVPDDLEALLMDGDGGYTLQVKGLGENVSALSAESIKGVIDVEAWLEDQELTKLTPGMYYMPISFALDGNIEMNGNVIAHVQIKKIEE
jgi:YbbR domain-containing protein